MDAVIQSSLKPLGRGESRGFTLLEFMAVLAIVAILWVLVTIGFQGILGDQFSSEVSDIANTLVRARAYAMANNTYAFVGLEEVQASLPATTVPQVAGNGRIGITVAATNDGTRGYNPTNPTAIPVAPTQLTIVSPLRHFENIHMWTYNSLKVSSQPARTGSYFNLAIPSESPSLYSAATSVTAFQWPLAGTAQYAFGTNTASPGSVIQFNPQGEAQIITGSNTDSILQWIEIDLMPTHGATFTAPTSATNLKDAAAILIDGPSGNISIYRT